MISEDDINDPTFPEREPWLFARLTELEELAELAIEKEDNSADIDLNKMSTSLLYLTTCFHDPRIRRMFSYGESHDIDHSIDLMAKAIRSIDARIAGYPYQLVDIFNIHETTRMRVDNMDFASLGFTEDEIAKLKKNIGNLIKE